MCCGKFDLSDSELQALTKPEKRKYRIGRRPLLKGLGATGLLAALGVPGLWPTPVLSQQVVNFRERKAFLKCWNKWIDCRMRGGGSSRDCYRVYSCCMQEEGFIVGDIRGGAILDPFCDQVLMARVLDAPDIRTLLEPLDQQLISGQCLPILQSGPLVMDALGALFEARHRMGLEIRGQQATGPLGVEVTAEANQVCGPQFSHSLFVSWRVYGGRPPVQVNIEITDPSGKTQRLTGATPEGMVRFELAFPGGGSAQVTVVAQDAGNSRASGQASVQLGPCR